MFPNRISSKICYSVSVDHLIDATLVFLNASWFIENPAVIDIPAMLGGSTKEGF